MTLKLNKDRDHAVVFPPLGRAHFMQNGFYFDQEGKLVNGEHVETDDKGRETTINFLDPKNETRMKRLLALDVANQAARAARNKALEAEGIDPATVPEDEDESEEAEKSDKFDLRAWARGEVKAIFSKVQEALREQHGYTATGRKSAIEFMVGEGLVEPEDVKV